MYHTPHISSHTPRLGRQADRHRRCAALQRAMRADPIVQVAPQPQRPLQRLAQPRNAAGAASQPRLLIAQRAVEAFHMGSVDLPADLESADQPHDFLFASEQRPRPNAQQLAGGVADFFHHAHEQSRRSFEVGMLQPPLSTLAAAMTDQAEHLQDRVGVGQMIVDQEQQGPEQNTGQATEHRHRGRQFGRRLQRAWTQTQVDQEPRLDLQSRVNPVSTQSATASRTPPPMRERARPPFFDAFLQTRPCNSSSSTASMGSSKRSSCWSWKSSARWPARLSIRTTTCSGSLVYCMSEPCRSLKRCWQWLQYKRRMDLSLPIRSATPRLPALNWLKRSQSGFGQANIARSWAPSLAWAFLHMRGLPANVAQILSDSPARWNTTVQEGPLSLPTS